MKKLYHGSIFYPEEIDKLNEMTESTPSDIKAKAIIVPHQDLRKAYKLYVEAFKYCQWAKRVIILAPLHSEKLLRDGSKFFFEGCSGSLETPLGKVELKALTDSVHEYYAEEEYSAELPILYIAKNMPEVEVSVVYSAIENAEEAKKYASLLKKWNNEYTLFIISSNLTCKMKQDEMLAKRDEGARLIESGDKLMELYRKKRVTMCAAPIIDALNRAIPGNWHLIGLNENDETTGHGAFFKEYI